MVSNRLSHCRLEMSGEGKVKMENGAGRGPEAAEYRISKWEMGEETCAGVPLRVRSVRVNVVLPVPRVPVRMVRPQRG